MRAVGRSALHNRTLQVADRRQLSMFKCSLLNRTTHGDTVPLDSLKSAWSMLAAEKKVKLDTYHRLRQLIRSKTTRNFNIGSGSSPDIAGMCSPVYRDNGVHILGLSPSIFNVYVIMF